jgi:WD40 repeat protein
MGATRRFSPDGRRIVTTSLDKTARIWDVTTQQQIAVLRGHTDHVWSGAFSPDGRRIVTAGDSTARIWNTDSGAQVAVLDHGAWQVNWAAFSPNGQRVLTAVGDSTARLWDVGRGQELVAFRGHNLTVNSAAFSADGRRVVTASDDRTARVWPAFQEIQELLVHTSEIAPRCLTPTQLEQAFLDPTPPAWCIEMEKWPYRTQAWKDWLAARKGGKRVNMPAVE